MQIKRQIAAFCVKYQNKDLILCKHLVLLSIYKGLVFIILINIYLILNSCRANWYYTSHRCRKLLLLIMNRTTSPCKITAGKIVILSIESFATVSIKLLFYSYSTNYTIVIVAQQRIFYFLKVVKTSLSYLTMFRSLQ